MGEAIKITKACKTCHKAARFEADGVFVERAVFSNGVGFAWTKSVSERVYFASNEVGPLIAWLLEEFPEHAPKPAKLNNATRKVVERKIADWQSQNEVDRCAGGAFNYGATFSRNGAIHFLRSLLK